MRASVPHLLRPVRPVVPRELRGAAAAADGAQHVVLSELRDAAGGRDRWRCRATAAAQLLQRGLAALAGAVERADERGSRRARCGNARILRSRASCSCCCGRQGRVVDDGKRMSGWWRRCRFPLRSRFIRYAWERGLKQGTAARREASAVAVSRGRAEHAASRRRSSSRCT